jgi:Flp pilus assembly protein TadG
MRRPAAYARGRNQHGSSAVEFALVLPLLCLLIFGIIDYGLLYNNSLSLRQGIRESARQGVVRNFSTTGCTTGTDLVNLVCKTDKTVGSIAGTTYSKVVVPQGWAKGKPLKVCSMVKTHGATGLVPYPSGGWLKQQVLMSIEVDTAPLPTGGSTYADTLPAGQSWSWCT